MDVEITYFFEGLDTSSVSHGLPHGGRNRIAIDLVRNFLEIADEDQRWALANLVKTLKAGPPGAPPGLQREAAISSA